MSARQILAAAAPSIEVGHLEAFAALMLSDFERIQRRALIEVAELAESMGSERVAEFITARN